MTSPHLWRRFPCRLFRGLSLSALCALTLTFTAFAAVSSKKNYDLPAGDAAKTLKLFSDQSGEQIVYPAEAVRGQLTNVVRGELTAREALDAMLAKTGLVAVQDEKTGALAVKKVVVPDAPKDTVKPREGFTPASSASDAGGSKTTPQNDNEVYVLSPFEVSAAADNGYAAATSLAGNRLNTELRDVGSAISVVTAQMLRDIGATSNESLLQYTTNTEVGNIYGNMANAGSGNQLDETSRFVAPNMNTRIRGLASADNTMDYFLTDMPWDSYNVDRVDMQRGPNAILFGLGSPAGIINAGTKQAGYRNRGQVEVRYSRFGSLRTTLDLNYALLPEELAVRINLLRNDEKFQQKPAFQQDERIVGAMRYEPKFLNKGSARTTIKANYETGRIQSNRPRAVPPSDLLTPWFATGTVQGYNTSTGLPQTYNNLNRMGFNASGLNSQAIASTGVSDRGQAVKTYSNQTQNPYWQPYLGGQFAAGYFGGPMAIYDSGDTAGVRFAAWEPTTIRGINSAGAIDGNISGFPGNLRMSSLTTYRDWANKIGLPGAGSYGLARAVHVTDPTVFDFYNNLIDGPNKQEWQNFHRYNVNLSQTFLNGDVGIEGVYDRQHYDNGQLVFMSDKGQALYIDVMQIMADGTLNPNYGRPFIADSAGNNRVTNIEREARRLTGFVKHDFSAGRPDSIFARILGRQQLTAFVNKESRKTDSRSFVRYSTDLAFQESVYGLKSLTTGNPININFDDSRRTIYPVMYLGASLKDRTSAAGAYIPAPTAYQVARTGTIRVFDSTWTPPAGVNPGDVWTNPDYPVGNASRNSTQAENPANYKGWVSKPFNVIDSEEGNRDALTTGASLTKSTISSKALVWNGYFWNGGLVGMYGWRHDSSKAWSAAGARTAVTNPATGTSANTGPINLDRSVYKLPDAYRDRIDEESKSWSVVAHLAQLFPRIPLPVDVSLFYNQSQNFAASAGRVGPLNENLGPPKGDTTDMGLLIATRDGKYRLKVNKYESTVKNATSSFGNMFYLSQFFTTFNPWKNVFKHKIDTNNSFDLSGPTGTNPTRWLWLPATGMDTTQTAALEASSITAWETMITQIPQQFFDAYKIAINQVSSLTASTPSGLSVTEDNVSKGYEAEFYASPIRNLRLTFNASKAMAIRDNVGQPSLTNLVGIINTALNSTDAGKMRLSSSATSVTALSEWNANFMAQYNGIKQQQGGKVPEMREWRTNFIANYDFTDGLLKGFNIGVGYRWQSKVIIGYAPAFFNADGTPATNHILAKVAVLQLDKPFYGPAENNIDLWIGYKRKLTNKINFRTQLNVRNVGKGNSLIPVTVQPDGTVAGWRIAPTQVWSLTNTLEF